ncbi:MAG: hypothetical protein GWO19_13870 [Nitrospinaceae bacterium]|nr:hypothetical protein [Nitrospinaceae bacterium]NIS85962.1 hypothetical protein [Nitrospinaceae bacterium]NIU45010.1 hypothetical protein [Nitrospinaceae bacterium]NIU97181.1 hypothetical protein [Nitrospinaceae bacterium]NIW59757.1 hypothetical protein [Nitrospinaceae bacterium]
MKKKFVDEQGEVQLAVDNRQALADYVNAKVKNIEKMAESPSLTPVEKQAARQLARSIKRELQRAAEAK